MNIYMIYNINIHTYTYIYIYIYYIYVYICIDEMNEQRNKTNFLH